MFSTFKVYTSSKGNSFKRVGLEMDDGLEDQHRGAPHQDNYQSSGAEDYMSDWLFDANAAVLKQIDPTKWWLDWLQIAEFVAAFVLQCFNEE